MALRTRAGRIEAAGFPSDRWTWRLRIFPAKSLAGALRRHPGQPRRCGLIPRRVAVHLDEGHHGELFVGPLGEVEPLARVHHRCDGPPEVQEPLDIGRALGPGG